MGHTNETANVELSQFLGTDKPAWLVDYNGDMAKIDAYAYATRVKANANESAITSLSNRVGTIENDIANTITPALTSAQNNITTLQGNITTINSLIGNGIPTTTDQTIIGAINEINAIVTDLADSDIGDSIAITSGSQYTPTSDGYLKISLASSEVQYVEGTLGKSGRAMAFKYATPALSGIYTDEAFLIYVKKGLTISFSAGNGTVRFYPMISA